MLLVADGSARLEQGTRADIAGAQGLLDRQLAYWTQQLADLPPVCTFPSDHRHAEVQSGCGARYESLLGRDLIEALRAFAQRENATLFKTLLAAFKTLLFRYNGQEDCVLGTPGINTLVLRTSLAGDPSFTDLLGRVRRTVLDAHANPDVPLERIVEKLPVARDASRMSLFQVMFAFQHDPQMSGPGAELHLTLKLAEIGDGLAATWQFNPDLFEPATIERLARQWRTLLEGIASDGTRRLSELPLLTADEQREIEIEWNRTDVPQAVPGDFVQQFEAQVERTPEAVAVQCDDELLTYRQLNARVNQLARYLQTLGIAPERLVGVCLPRSADTFAVLLAVWKAGGAFLPIDSEYPPERIAFMLRDAGVSLLVTQTRLLAKFSAALDSVTQPVCIDSLDATVASQNTRNVDVTREAGALAYVIYTSGSTGNPKGVMITHGNVCHYAQAMAQALAITAQDRYLHTASFSFSSSVRQLVVPLSCGAAISVASVDAIRDTQLLFERVRDHNVSVLDFVPSFSASCLQVLNTLDSSSRAALLENRVRLLLSASEPLPSALVTGWRRLLKPGTAFINMFGQTETAGIVMTHPIPESGESAAIVPIGRPIANTQAYVLDASLRIVPPGVCGELCIGGAGIGRGYINRPEQNDRSFVPSPFNRQRSGRLYRTGDTARYRSDGVIEIVGRADEQVKVRGFRIEPGEIEAVLRTHPAVRECFVSAIAETSSDHHKHLVAFVATDPTHTAEAPLVATLRSHVMQRLPDYMVPQRIVTLDTLPRTANGKLDRRALLAKLEPAPAAPQAPVTVDAESVIGALTALWQSLLGRDDIRPDEDFFDLGGDSLMAVTLMISVRQRFGKVLPLATLFEAGTIDKLAAVITGGEKQAEWSHVVPIHPTGSRAPLFCIHPGGGNVLGYSEFVAHLDPDLPVYGLQAHGVVEGQQPHNSIPEMARIYLQEIRKVQPRGPYYLGGESFGGLVAYEIACQIVAAGERVALLFLGDTWTCNVPQFNKRKYALTWLRYLPSVSWAQWRGLFARKVLRQRALALVTKRYVYADELHRQMLTAHRQAMDSYFPNRFPGKVTLFRALDRGHNERRQQLYFGGPGMCWPALAAGGVEVHWAPGVHTEMMHGPNAHGFARTLQDCIDRASGTSLDERK